MFIKFWPLQTKKARWKCRQKRLSNSTKSDLHQGSTSRISHLSETLNLKELQEVLVEEISESYHLFLQAKMLPVPHRKWDYSQGTFKTRLLKAKRQKSCSNLSSNVRTTDAMMTPTPSCHMVATVYNRYKKRTQECITIENWTKLRCMIILMTKFLKFWKICLILT